MEHSLFLKACFKQPTERTPIWIMRQAGRYLPEYRAVRSRTTFLGLCKNPELAAEVTLQPIDILGVDAAIIFSDILILPEAMGMQLTIEEGEGPRLFPVLQKEEDLERLKIPTTEVAYSFLNRAIGLVQKALRPRGIPLLGFAGSPWTLLVYMVEGGGSRDFIKLKKLIYSEPKTAHAFLEKICQGVIDLLNYQIESGVDAVQIFDSWGGILARDDFLEFSLAYVEKVIAHLNRKKVPVLFFAKGTGAHLERIRSCGADVVSLDWTVDLGWASQVAQGRVALQGNLDPTILFASTNAVEAHARTILQKVPASQAHIFNLGHGILPGTPVENVKALIHTVKNFKY